MANLTDLQNRLQTIAEAEKNGGILDIPTEAIQILAMCNSIRIEMINEMCEGIDPEQCDEQLFIQLISRSTLPKGFKVYKCTDCGEINVKRDNGEIRVGFCDECEHPLWN